MNFISLCSGIEAASLAFSKIGWKALAFSEIEKFPSALLQHYYPDTPNLGDMNGYASWSEETFRDADLIVGGPPCQAYSLSGLRNGLNDKRGNLTLTYAKLINYADCIREKNGREPVIAFYENVPGILSDKTNAFGHLLAGLCGEEDALIAPGKKWANAGYVHGPQRAIAWRVLDAQYFGLAQRRKRVYVVASAKDGFDPAKILFEFEGLRRDIEPSRKTRKGITRATESCTGSNGKSENDPIAFVQNTRNEIRLMGGDGSLVGALAAQAGMKQQCYVAYPASQIASSLTCNTEPCGHDAGNFTCNQTVDSGYIQLVLVEETCYGVRTANTSSNGWGIREEITHTFDCAMGIAVAHPIALNATIDLHGAAASILAFNCKDDGWDAIEGITPTMRALGHVNSHASGGGHLAVSFITSIDSEDNARAAHKPLDPLLKDSPTGGGKPLPAVLLPNLKVRRLMPVECEGLMGFPDGFTDIPFNKKPASDGPRYRALGNSWAIPVVAFIGERIEDYCKTHAKAVDSATTEDCEWI